MGELSKTTINGVSYDFKDAGAARQSHSHTKSQITDFPTSMPASDVSSWAKASSKPSYTASEVNAVATTANQGLSDTQKSNARANIGAGTSSFSGSYNDLSNKPTIPTKTSQLTNDSGYTTNVGTVTQVKVGSTAYNPSSGVVSLPAYPTTLPASDVSSWAKASSKPSYTASEVGAIATSAKGAANGVASLDSAGKVPSSQLPSYVDDVLEYSAKSSFPSTGETGKIYVDTSTNKTYRWSGSAYVEISASLALGETSSTAYYGDKGKTAYTHSQSTHARTDATKAEISNGVLAINGTATNIGNFKSVSTVASQGLSDTEKSNARANIGAGTSSLTVGTGASNAAAGNHTHGLSLATESGTSSISLAANTKYKLTAGGSTYVFTTPPDNNTTYGVVSTSANGLAPKVTDTSKFLKGDGTWATPANTWTPMVGATSSANGSVGYVNATPPKDGYNTKYLRADGAWVVPPNTTYSDATTSASGLMSATDKSKLNGIATGATAVSESTVSGWGFTKNTGTYSKPSTGIPKTDLASAVQTSLGKADSALQSHQTIKQDGITGATVNRFGTCSTAAGTAAKTVSVTSGTFTLEAGARVTVKFSNANTAGTPTLNVNSKGAKNIFHKGAQITTGSNKALLAGTVDFIYDGTQWHLIGNYIDTNTTYSSKSAASGGTDVSLCTTGEKYSWNNKGTYSKPSGGIPKSDLASAVQTSLGKADTALQSFSTKGADLQLGTASSSSNDSGDIVFYYGNGNEKARIWTNDTYTSADGPRFRISNSSGSALYTGNLVLGNGIGATPRDFKKNIGAPSLKNLIDYNHLYENGSTEVTIANTLFVLNADGSIRIKTGSGGASGDATYVFQYISSYAHEFDDCVLSGGYNENVVVRIERASDPWTPYATSTGNAVAIDSIPIYAPVNAFVRVKGGTSVDKTIYPMICKQSVWNVDASWESPGVTNALLSHRYGMLVSPITQNISNSSTLYALKMGKTVLVSGYMSNISFTANVPVLIGTIDTNVGRPGFTMRSICNIGPNEYSASTHGYVAINTDGTIYVSSAYSGTGVVYFTTLYFA